MALKLNKVQMEALARKISTEIKAEAIANNKAITDSEEYKKFCEVDKECLLVKELFDKYHFDVYYCNAILNRIKSCNFENRLIAVPSVHEEEILDDIIIETIECDDLDTLIKKITQKYKK